MLESTIEKAVCAYARKQGMQAIKFKDPSRAGAPDRIFLAPGGEAFFIEFKAPGKEPKKHQTHCHKKLRLMGFHVSVVDDIDDGKCVIDFFIV